MKAKIQHGKICGLRSSAAEGEGIAAANAPPGEGRPPRSPQLSPKGPGKCGTNEAKPAKEVSNVTEIANTENVIFQKPVKKRAGFLKVLTKLTSGKTDKKNKRHKSPVWRMNRDITTNPTDI